MFKKGNRIIIKELNKTSSSDFYQIGDKGTIVSLANNGGDIRLSYSYLVQFDRPYHNGDGKWWVQRSEMRKIYEDSPKPEKTLEGALKDFPTCQIKKQYDDMEF